MPNDYPLTLRQADQARSDFAAIQDDLDFIQAQLARVATLLTHKELARLTLLATFTGAALVLAGIAVLFR
jgi:hypothetical protein